MQKIEHLNDIVRIQRIFRLIDFDVEYAECAEMWHTVSAEEEKTGWMMLPESDTEVLRLILQYFDFSSKNFNEFYKPNQYLKTSITVNPVQIRKNL